ncbi:MAG: hypothetical protein ABI665_27240 [Vicinamibacterales bacterium]
MQIGKLGQEEEGEAMTEKQRQDMEAARVRLRAAALEPEDPNWAEGLEEAPPIPTTPEQTVVVIQKKKDTP